MAALRRPIALLLVSALGLGLPAPVAQAADPGAANSAARWLAAQASAGVLDDGFSTVGATADGLIALASADDPALKPTVAAMLDTVRAGAADYVASGGGSAAGKLAIVAAAHDLDPADFGGVDLVAKLRAGVAADGSVGPYPSAFGSGLAAAGFERSGATTPAALTTWLIGQQNADGGFGYAAGQASDADNTALAIVGLATDPSAAADAALAKAVDWAAGAQRSDGSWAGYVPVNSTCVLGSALTAAGIEDADALAFVKGKQLANGAIDDGSGANVMATSQCAPFLAGVSYLDVAWAPRAGTPAPSPSEPADTATPPAPTTSKPATQPATRPAGSPTASPTSSAPGRGVPARTGAEEELPVAPLAVGGLVVAALVAAARQRA